MGDYFNRDKFRRPEILLNDFLKKGAQGMFREKDEGVQFLYRALVIAVDVEGSKLENPDGSGELNHEVDGKKYSVPARVGPKNPPNSIKARIITDGLDKFSTDDNLRVFWPFFPENISVPVKPGEHVYVTFEDANFVHGLWITKVPGHVGMNYAPGKKFFKASDSGQLASKFEDTSGGSSEEKKFDKDEDAAETKPGNKLSSLFG